MNYNEYDSNGNRNKFNLQDIISDKQKRSRVLLVIYALFFLIAILIVRSTVSKSLNNNQDNKTSNEVINNNVENNNIENNNNTDNNVTIDTGNMFAFIDFKNYQFEYNVDVDGSISLIEGKRFNDKYSFTMNNNGYILYFNGTTNYIRAKESIDGEYKVTGFPYMLINIFDIDTIKNIISKSTVNGDIYEISNAAISEITHNDLDNKEGINKIELIKRNNKITEIKIDLSSAISSYMKKSTNAIISLKYSDFGLIDDFKIE